jgi:hypothetical protein
VGFERETLGCVSMRVVHPVTTNAYRQALQNPPALDGHNRSGQLATTSACYMMCLPRSQTLWRYRRHNATGLYSTVYARIISKTTIHYPASDFFDRNPLARGSTSTTHLKSTWLSHGWPRSATVPSPLWLLLTLSFSRSLPTTSQAGSRSFAPSLPRDKV